MCVFTRDEKRGEGVSQHELTVQTLAYTDIRNEEIFYTKGSLWHDFINPIVHESKLAHVELERFDPLMHFLACITRVETFLHRSLPEN